MSKVKKKVSDNSEVIEKPLYNYILLLVFAILICFFTTYKIASDDDVFWHLATGKYIVQTFSIPSADVFGYVTYGQKWMPFEWGWDVLTYSLFSMGGYVAISLLRTIIVLLIFTILFSVFNKNNISFSLSLIFSFLLILGILTRLVIRPQIITYFFLVLLVFTLLKFRQNEKEKKSIMYILPVIFVIWANMHMGVFLGLLILFIYIISETVDYYFISKGDKKEVKKKKLIFLTVSSILSVLALLINPNFITTYIYTFQHSQMDMLENINEWKSPLRSEPLKLYNVKIYLFFLVSGLIILPYSLKKKDYFSFLLYISLGIYSLQAMRFISDFMLSIIIIWMSAVNFYLSKTKIFKFVNGNVTKLILGVFLVFIIIKTSDNSFYKDYLGNRFRETGFGENEMFFPKSMFDFVRNERIDKIGEKPFNNLKIGGYFIWNFPENKNFIDSRNLSDSMYNLYKSIDLKKQGFESLIDKVDFDYFLYSTPYLTLNATEIEKNIVSYLTIKNDKWKLVYWDDRSFLFVKNIPKFNDIIARCEYKYVSPYNFIFMRNLLNNNYNSDKATVINEINRKIKEEPNGILINDIAKYYKR